LGGTKIFKGAPPPNAPTAMGLVPTWAKAFTGILQRWFYWGVWSNFGSLLTSIFLHGTRSDFFEKYAKARYAWKRWETLKLVLYVC